MDNQFISLAAKTLIVILVITILMSAAVFFWREQWHKEWLGTVRDGFTDFPELGKPGLKYIMWIGDVATTLDILNLAQQPGTVVQPIYIPDPMNSAARTEYELQITRTLRTMINTKYPQSQILPIISITKERPDDTAFNQEYDQIVGDVNSEYSPRENILHRWAKYYKLELAQPSTATNDTTLPTKSANLQQPKNQKQKQKSNANILSETWNCRFPIGTNNIPCGLCKKCEKLNSF
jgi:hypothetical protein